jgi:hypothetical protein
MTDTHTDNLGTVNRTPTEISLDSNGRFRGFVTDTVTGRLMEIGGKP